MNEKNAQLSRFLSGQCELGPDYKEGKTEFFKAFSEWSCASGLSPLSLNDVVACMKEYGFAELRTKSKRYWSGVHLRSGSRMELPELTDRDSLVERSGSRMELPELTDGDSLVEMAAEETPLANDLENLPTPNEVDSASGYSACELLLLRNMGVDQITKRR